MLDEPREAEWPPEGMPDPEPTQPWSAYAPDGLLATLLDHRFGGRGGSEQAGAELALALRISPGAADCRVHEALTLTRRYPAAVEALEAGAVTLTKVRIIAEQTEQLSDEQATSVTDRVLPKAGGQTPAALRAAVRRAVARTDPDAVRRRQAAAVADRGVWLYEHPVCQAPGCARAAVDCDLDHHTPHHRSGTTTVRDTGPYCRRHHRLKQTPRWQVTRDPDGSVTWTTPSGHTYTSTPPPVAEPQPPPPASDRDEPPPF